jgi:VWFA-related protein
MTPRGFAAFRRVLLLSGALGLPAALAVSQPAPPPPPPVFGEKVEVTSVDVLVLNQAGDPVRGLTPQDFTVKEDGVVQTITSFEAIGFEESEASEAARDLFVSSNVVERVRPERAFLVIYDDVHLTPLGARLAQKEFEKLVDGLAPGDVVSLVSTSNRSMWTARLPAGREELLAFARDVKGLKPMDRTPGRISDWEAMQIYYGRDASVLGMVARRYYENGLIAELTPPSNERQSRKELEVSPGLLLIRAKAQQVYEEAARGEVASLEVMKRAVAALGTQRGRKSVLVLSEGFLHDSTRSELRELVETAREANAVLYFFDARGASGPNAPNNEAESWRALEERDVAATVANFARDAEGTESAAYDTGGRVVKGTDDLARAMLQVARESRVYYLLGYVSSNQRRDGKFRNIKVTVARPGLEVRARKGYYGPRKTDEKKPTPVDKLDPRVRAGLDSPFDSDKIPIQMASYVLGRGASGKTTVVLAAELDLGAVAFAVQGGRQVGVLDTYALVSPLGSGGVQIVEKRIDLSLPPDLHARVLKTGLPIIRDFELASGRYQSRVLIRDARGGAVGTVRHTFEVPPAGAFHISTPILTDTLTPGPGGQQVPVPLAHRHFPKGSRIFYVFDVYGAKADGRGGSEVAIRYVLRRKDGAVLSDAPARDVRSGGDGSLSHRLELSLAAVEPGEYELLLTVEDKGSGSRLERQDVFFVDPPRSGSRRGAGDESGG